jgi:hypothetical protein
MSVADHSQHVIMLVADVRNIALLDPLETAAHTPALLRFSIDHNFTVPTRGSLMPWNPRCQPISTSCVCPAKVGTAGQR